MVSSRRSLTLMGCGALLGLLMAACSQFTVRGTSIVGFNLGVEIGQLVLVAGATLFVALLAKCKFALPRALVVDAASLSAAARGSPRGRRAMGFAVSCALAWCCGTRAEPAASAASTSLLQEVVVTAKRLELIGTASTASEGVVVDAELALVPAYRPGQLLESVPGLDVTSHSGEGKANQYLMRGYNLDHGTDLAIFVDDMPINEPTHAHGQGYADVNFMIPELATTIRYTKGTYYANEGDFGSVGSVRVNYLQSLDEQVAFTAGSLGFQRLLSAASHAVGAGDLLGALELQHYDGPWEHPDDQRKINAVLRYSGGSEQDGYSATGMFYQGHWNSNTDQPLRAIAGGTIGRFGSIDPTDGGQAQRASVSARFAAGMGGGQLSASLYAINNQLTLWNDFTHFLADPVNGDQEAQHENRITVGGVANFSRGGQVAGLRNEWMMGVSARFDFNDVWRIPTLARAPLPAKSNPRDFYEKDRVHLRNLAWYAQATTHWQTWLRTVVALREDGIGGGDSGTNPGSANASVLQPKASLIITPMPTTEFYLSVGRGFHSDDLRGVNRAAISGAAGAPLIARQDGREVGVRRQVGRRLALTLALYSLDAQSETTYDPDQGEDSAGPASRRRGFELNVTYQAAAWLELYGSYSADHARFKAPFDDGTGHLGTYLPNAPFATGSVTLFLKELGAWSGGLQYRYLSAYPLSSDGAIRGSGYGEWNGDIRRAFGGGWTLALGVYNMTNKKANAAEYWYVDRLAGETAAGAADVHVHPLEPISARLTLAKIF